MSKKEDQQREQRAKKYWYEHQLSWNGPEPLAWETMAEFARLEIQLERETKK